MGNEDNQQFLENNLEEIKNDIISVVELPSPTKNKKLVDDCLDKIDKIILKYLNCSPKVFKQENYGDHRLYKIFEGKKGKNILILAHVDTVWEKDDLSLKIGDGYISGPGVLDMKSGLIQAIWALKAIHDLNLKNNNNVSLFVNSDEEIGSPSSKELIVEIAENYDHVLVVEPPDVDTGALKTGRKGSARFEIEFYGKESHAGNNHKDGINAIDEAAKHILDLAQLTNYEKGLTINVGHIEGGGKLNVVPNYAKIGLNARAKKNEDLVNLHEKIQNIEPYNSGVEIKVTGDINRPVMAPEVNKSLFKLAKEVGAKLGMSIRGKSVGGGSDGNFTSSIGIPTLDGLGAVGEGIHQRNEKIYIEYIPQRTALISELIINLKE